jgi:glycosyltransferase involved in cell wall biosynthesis
VVVPAHDAAALLPTSLGALRASDLPSEAWELIVVDDASGDDTAAVAERHADRVLRLPAPARGPAYARNHGAAAARGEILVFVDADVCVHPDALRRFAELFAREPDVAAAFGAYDTRPAAGGLVSQYRNLLHHYVHSESAGDAETFWAGCGAVRARVFTAAGMFDARRYPRPQIEDIELGHRLRALGHRIVLRPDIQGTHLKRWTLAGMVTTDLRDRGVPWMRLLLQRRGEPRRDTLNIRRAEKVYTALVGVALAATVAAAWGGPRWLVLAAACVAAVIGGNARLYLWFARQRGWAFALQTVPLRMLYYALNGVSAAAGWLAHALLDRRPSHRVAGA